MRGTLEQILQKFGVDYVLRPYETMPFDYFNADKGFDVMAEIALSGDKQTISAAIQHIEHTADGDMKIKQIYQFMAMQDGADKLYMPKQLRILDKNMVDRLNWFDGGCRFFKQCTALIKKGTAPDFEAIYKATFGEAAKDGAGEAFSGGSGSRNLKNDKPVPPPPKPPGKL
ncbi:MAG TPA: hypothetical protein VGF14_01680 [Alphaproteobacteria bacterium]